MKFYRSEFLKTLKAEFPALRDPINAEEGLLHFEMDVFRHFIQQAIGTRDEIVAWAFELANKAYRNGNAKLRNVVDVSFVEPMDFNSWAWERLPETLRDLYFRFHGKTGA